MLVILPPLGSGNRSVPGRRQRTAVHVVTADPAVDSTLDAVDGLADLAALHHRNSDDFLARYDPVEPACLLLDLSRQGIGGLGMVRDLRARGIMLPTLILGRSDDTTLAAAAIKCGASGFASLPLDANGLAVQLAELLEQALPASQQRQEIQQLKAAVRKLSAREHEVFLKIVAGRSVKQIAHDMGLSIRTVHIYKANCLLKLGVETVVELVRLLATAPKELSEAPPATE